MAFLTQKKATSNTPQVVTLVVDDSGSMKQNSKASQAAMAIQDLVIGMQAGDQGAGRFRFLLNIAKFGDQVTPLAVAKTPKEIELNSLQFSGDSGMTNMPSALEWAATATSKALDRCREYPGFVEANSPPPLVVFFSDGENTESAGFGTAVQSLHSVSFEGASIDVVACGIGLSPKDKPTMEQIASKPDLAVIIDPNSLQDFIANVAVTVTKGERPKTIVERSVKI